MPYFLNIFRLERSPYYSSYVYHVYKPIQTTNSSNAQFTNATQIKSATWITRVNGPISVSVGRRRSESRQTRLPATGTCFAVYGMGFCVPSWLWSALFKLWPADNWAFHPKISNEWSRLVLVLFLEAIYFWYLVKSFLYCGWSKFFKLIYKQNYCFVIILPVRGRVGQKTNIDFVNTLHRTSFSYILEGKEFYGTF